MAHIVTFLECRARSSRSGLPRLPVKVMIAKTFGMM
jgi:hypothetical protein